MKKKPKRLRRQIFVLTPEERKIVACVLGALVLGIATKHYRDTHPSPEPKPTARQQYQQQRAEKAAKAYARSARGQREAAAKAAAAAAEAAREAAPATPSPPPDEKVR